MDNRRRRVYVAAWARPCWRRTIDEKLRTLANLYQLLNEDLMNNWMLTLEVTIVPLFIIDLIILAWGWKR